MRLVPDPMKLYMMSITAVKPPTVKTATVNIKTAGVL
jgi:hypothetical protein